MRGGKKIAETSFGPFARRRPLPWPLFELFVLISFHVCIFVSLVTFPFCAKGDQGQGSDPNKLTYAYGYGTGAEVK